ncbi:uncharacterized protein BDW47DRAFT_115913 [Aspergillus candidus]|uniref:Uncharacterized protein n=1 Tax=Aspergillus candidus TaxID=41067 RepID=A0A2I2FIT7_ASPCN|nr:hypothetical protein BDW47DRAFT_115913 [Aspergillus candidus]PLB40542.1 hypothetical protein BDW47DRAFT_115913 [Aspergillus candidus]
MGISSKSSCQASSKTAGSSTSTASDTSDRSRSTVPTIYSDRPTSKRMEPIDTYAQDPRDSASTYASTASPVDESPELPPRYEVTDRRLDAYSTDVLPSTPSTFGKLFPSSRRLLIRHDDATIDGNMNLRVDTVVHHRGGYQQDVTLFHLRMYDLFSRKSSFRRYCRESGREICHSERRPVQSSLGMKPVFRRSWNSVLASLRPGSSGHGSAFTVEPRSQYLGCQAARDEVVDGEEDMDEERSVHRPVALAENTLLEFSNYARVEIRRRGAGLPKRYEYEYWSTKYQWRRESRREGDLRGVSYHLFDTRASRTIAHMVPDILTPMEEIEEESKGGWIPPSSMWISDASVYEKMPDAADVIVATGLMVLVDDCIRRRWHSDKSPPLARPMRHSISRGVELIGPKRLIDEVFHRRGSA